MLSKWAIQLLSQRACSMAACQAVSALQALRLLSTGEPSTASEHGGSAASVRSHPRQQHHLPVHHIQPQHDKLKQVHVLLDDDATASELEQGAQQLQRQGYMRAQPTSSLAASTFGNTGVDGDGDGGSSSSSRLNAVSLDQIMALIGDEELAKALMETQREGAPARVQEALDRLANTMPQGTQLDAGSSAALARLQASELHSLCQDFDLSVHANGMQSWHAAAAQAIAQLVCEQRLQQGHMETVSASTCGDSDSTDGMRASSTLAGSHSSSSSGSGSNSTSISSGSIETTSSSSQDIEALVDELFDAELQQRLASASAAAAAPASSSRAHEATSTEQASPSLSQRSQQQSLAPSAQSLQTPMWFAVPGGSSDPWAPLPGAAAVRAAVRARILTLLLTHQHDNRPAAADAVAGGPEASTPGASAPLDASALSALPRSVLEEALADCGAATHGSQEDLAGRLAAVLGGNAAAITSTESSLPTSAGAGNVGMNHGPAPLKQQRTHQQDARSKRREQVLAAAAQRRELLSKVVNAQEVGQWLLAAHMRDVCILSARAEGGSAAQQYILATGMSDRHVAASVAAVRWQLKERLAELGESVQPLVRMEVPAVVGSAESEWCCLDAGDVVVHAFTDRARAYYDIEGLLMEEGAVAVQRLKSQERPALTKDSITAGTSSAHG